MSRWLKLEPALVGSTVAALYVAAAMVYRALTHTGVFAPDELVAAAYALYGLYTRARVTPVALPRDAGGRALVPAAPAAPAAPPVPPVAPGA